MHHTELVILLEVGYGQPHLTPEFHLPSAIWWRYIFFQTPSQVIKQQPYYLGWRPHF